MKILVVDDDETSRLLVRRRVERLGHECQSCIDGEKAWELCQQENFDVVISDWTMPNLDGLQLCQLIRSQSHEHYTYFIILSAHGQQSDIIEGMRAGADDYLVKPVGKEAIEARLISAERVTTLHRSLAAQKQELARLNQVFYESARTDALTQVGNRLRLLEDLEETVARVARYNHRYSLVLFDVDYFKFYNDTYGHLKGDDVLRRVAQVLRSVKRSGDGAYRYGGEEFLLILPEQSVEQAQVAVERVRQGVESLGVAHIKSPWGHVTLSAGIALLGEGGYSTTEACLKAADAALYESKQNGRNAWRVAAPPAASENDKIDTKIEQKPTEKVGNPDEHAANLVQ